MSSGWISNSGPSHLLSQPDRGFPYRDVLTPDARRAGHRAGAEMKCEPHRNCVASAGGLEEAQKSWSWTMKFKSRAKQHLLGLGEENPIQGKEPG